MKRAHYMDRVMFGAVLTKTISNAAYTGIKFQYNRTLMLSEHTTRCYLANASAMLRDILDPDHIDTAFSDLVDWIKENYSQYHWPEGSSVESFMDWCMEWGKDTI